MLAEAVSFTEEEILAILLVLLGMVVAVAAIVVLGCVWAWRAGRGSQLALGGLVVVAVLEASAVLAALPGVLNGDFFVFAPAAVIALQAALYLVARDRARPRP